METVLTFILGKAVPTSVLMYAVKIFWDIRKAMWDLKTDYQTQKKECDGKFNVMGVEITHIKEDVKEHESKISMLEEFKNKISFREKHDKES